MNNVIAIRPEPGLASTIAAGAARGLPIAGWPLSQVAPVGWTMPDLTSLDGLLIGSANAFRHGGDKLEALTHLPVLAVGKATAEAATTRGFAVEHVGQGGLQALLETLEAGPRSLLRLAGAEHIALETPSQITLTTRVVYHLQPLEMPEHMRRALGQPCCVLLHSAAAAQHFVDECERFGVQRDKIALAALGPRILEGVGMGWRAALPAEMPEENALLALARELSR